MEYEITQKGVDAGRFEELGTIEVVCEVDGHTESLVSHGYLTPVEEINPEEELTPTDDFPIGQACGINGEPCESCQ